MPVAPPRDPALAQRIDQVRAELDAVEAHSEAGQLTAGLALAREAVAAARPLAYAPVLAEALLQNGRARVPGRQQAPACRSCTRRCSAAPRPATTC